MSAPRPLPGLRPVASGGVFGAEIPDCGQSVVRQTINACEGDTPCSMTVPARALDDPPWFRGVGTSGPGHEVGVLDKAVSPTGGEGDIAARRGSARLFLGDRKLPRDADLLRFVFCGVEAITSAEDRIGPAGNENCLQARVKTRGADNAHLGEIAFLPSRSMTVTGKVIGKELKRRAAAEQEAF